MDIKLITDILFTLSAIALMLIEIKWDMQMMQQNSYRNERFTKWLKTSSEYASSGRLMNLVMLMLALSTFMDSWIVEIILSVAIIAKCISALKKKYKKPLVFTRRVLRLYITESLALIAISVLVGFLRNQVFEIGLISLFVSTFSYMATLAFNNLLKPVEQFINDKYVKDAKRILAQMPDMKIIGITGSYGKTSTKHYLYRILSEKYSVLMTPGSYNTPMGVVRTVREMLQPYNDVFIVEMGAKNIGDIKEICDIVHPQMGIVTAVGAQHLESFKTIENVQRTKFELIDALPSDGFAVINNDFEYVANRKVDNVEVKRYTVMPKDAGDYHVEDISYSASGTQFTIVGCDKRIELTTRLVGECNISNLLAAVIIAMKLGVEEQKIKYAVSRIEQVEHRLNIKRTSTGITIIDDAFNSNPDGSRMALDVLAGMTNGKRIVITPGMIELGSKQEYFNELFGEHIASACDIAIIVGQYNRESIVKGMNRKGMDKSKIHTVSTFAEAQKLMLSLAKAGDAVLYENDLPDSFK